MTAEQIIRHAQQSAPLTSPAPAAGYRQLPHNVEAEQGLLGALLVDNRALEKVSEYLRPEHFYAPPHQRIFEAILRLNDRGQTASPVTLKTYFESDEGLAPVGGAQYLADLAASIVTVVNAADYGRNIYELFLRRELIGIGEHIVNDAHDHSLDREAMNVVEDAEAQLFKLAENGDTRGGFTTLLANVKIAIEVAERAKNAGGTVSGVTTGLTQIDTLLGGLHGSDLLILAGRPSMGKTALAVNMAFNAAQRYADTGGKEGARVGIFSLEMSADQLATRILSEQSGISGDAIRKGNIKQEDFRRFVEASQRMASVPLFIDDTPALSISAVRTRARRLQRQHGLGMLVIDYLQLLQGTGSKQSTENRVNEISEITRGLKALAKELHIPVLALSQLSRAVEQRDDKRPQLADLRESGSIEQDADVVMFVYRPEYYLDRLKPEDIGGDKFREWEERKARAAGIAECIVAKQRHGPIDTAILHFNGNLTAFTDADADMLTRYTV